MQVIENEVVVGKTVVLDDKHFVNGRYTNCTLIYSGGEFGWVNTTFDNCQITLTGAAQRTANVLGHLGLVKPPDKVPNTPISVQ
jgi:hypothetical protein